MPHTEQIGLRVLTRCKKSNALPLVLGHPVYPAGFCKIQRCLRSVHTSTIFTDRQVHNSHSFIFSLPPMHTSTSEVSIHALNLLPILSHSSPRFHGPAEFRKLSWFGQPILGRPAIRSCTNATTKWTRRRVGIKFVDLTRQTTYNHYATPPP